jgi:hypothetical protein
MSVTRVRKVADGEELVLTEDAREAHLEAGLSDPRAESLERRHKALTRPEQRAPRPKRNGDATRKRRGPR